MLTNEPFFQALLGRQEDIELGYKKHENGYVMTEAEVATMNAALGLKKDATYRPYCLADGCRTMPRMFVNKTGFTCPHCGNKISFNLTRLS